MTFSIIARCAETGMFGVAVASSSPAVAARCAYAQAGVGAVASQNITDPRLGARALELMASGMSADEAVARLVCDNKHIEYRQILAVDSAGVSCVHSGSLALGIWGGVSGTDVACGGNLLASSSIPQIMADAFNASEGHLGDRLIKTMRAAVRAGGEAGPIHSAGMKLVRDVQWPVADLRCDWTENCPVEELALLWEIYAPQLDAYVTRALDPAGAPSFGVPGDE